MSTQHQSYLELKKDVSEEFAGKTIFYNLQSFDEDLGATALPEDDPRNEVFPGKFEYGGGHAIQDLVTGKDIKLVASAYGTDCYPRKNLKTLVNLKDLNEAVLFNPRNAYQNCNVAVKDEDIWAQIVDYSSSYPLGEKESLGEANYAQLESGKILLRNRDVLTDSLSRYSKAKEIATIFKKWIQVSSFFSGVSPKSRSISSNMGIQ